MSIFSRINHIPWKYIFGMNLSLLILAVTFVSMQPALQSTDNRPKANTPQATPVIKPVIDPAKPPRLTSTDPDWAKIGDAILIKGENLGKVPIGTIYVGTTEVPSGNIVEWQEDYLVFTVPENAATAPVSLVYKLPSGESVTIKTIKPLTITTKNL